MISTLILGAVLSIGAHKASVSSMVTMSFPQYIAVSVPDAPAIQYASRRNDAVLMVSSTENWYVTRIAPSAFVKMGQPEITTIKNKASGWTDITDNIPLISLASFSFEEPPSVIYIVYSP